MVLAAHKGSGSQLHIRVQGQGLRVVALLGTLVRLSGIGNVLPGIGSLNIQAWFIEATAGGLVLLATASCICSWRH